MGEFELACRVRPEYRYEQERAQGSILRNSGISWPGREKQAHGEEKWEYPAEGKIRRSSVIEVKAYNGIGAVEVGRSRGV